MKKFAVIGLVALLSIDFFPPRRTQKALIQQVEQDRIIRAKPAPDSMPGPAPGFLSLELALSQQLHVDRVSKPRW